MLNKRIMILAIFLMGLLAVGAVSAQDNSTADIVYEESATNDAVSAANNDIADAEDSNNMVDGDSNFASPKATTDELKTDENDDALTAGPKTFTDLNSKINANPEKEIYLHENYTFNPNNDTEFIRGVTINREVTIWGNGITISGADTARIFQVTTNDNVVFHDITFTNGYVHIVYGNGGAINGGKNTAAVNCTFTNNNADAHGGAMFNGRAINCTFINNQAGDGSGAMEGETAINCTFTNNQASNGGAMEGGTAINCTFTNNQAGEDGGAMYTGTAINCTFTNNQAGEDGGAMYTGTATKCTFIINHAGKGHHYDSQTKINDCTVIDSAELSVSDFITTYNSGEKPSFTLINETRIINGAYTRITILQNDEEYYTFTGQEWPVDLKRGVSKAKITIIFPDGSENPHVGSKTIEIKTTDGATFSDLNNAINCNNATEITLDKNYTYDLDVDSEFKKGILISREVTINGNGCTIDGNKSARIFHITATNVVINNVTFINGWEEVFAGAIMCDGYNCLISNCTFKNNSASFGGAIICGSWYVSISNCNFVDNTADYGAAIQWREAVDGKISNCNFEGNNASINGGAIYWLHSNGHISNCTFVGNDASQRGGAIYCSGNYTYVSGCLFINNTAGFGIIYYESFYKNVAFNDNIFLNHKRGSEIYFTDVDDTSNIDYNWFGNTADDYDEMPRFNNVKPMFWLFLNATAIPNKIPVFGESDIIFELLAYNTSKGPFEYNNSRLRPLNLALSAKNGELSDTHIKLGDTVKYTSNTGSDGSVNARVENVDYTIELNVIKTNPNLSVEGPTVTYGENATVILNYNPNATGKVNITLTGKKHQESYLDMVLNATITLPGDVLPDEYVLDVTYSGDDAFLNATASGKLVVNYLPSDIKVVGYNLTVTDINGIMFAVIVPENATGNFSLTDGSSINVVKHGRKENHQLIVEIRDMAYPVGRYNWTFIYWGDDIYGNSSTNATSYILPIETQVVATNKNMNLTIGEVSRIDYSLDPNGAVGNITFSSENPEMVTVDCDGNVKAISPGSTIVTLTFSGSENYTASNTTVTVNVLKANSKVTISPITNATYKENVTIEYSIENKTFVNVTVVGVPEENIIVNDDIITVINLGAGNYTLIVANGENELYHASNDTKSFTVNRADISMELYGQDIEYGQIETVHVGLPADATNNVTVKLEGIYENSTAPYKGSADFSINSLKAGNYTVKAIYPGDGNYNSATATCNITVYKAKTVMDIITPSQITFKDNSTMEIILPNDATGNVTVKVENTILTTVPVENGTAKIALSSLTAGNHTIEAIYSGDDNYNPANRTVNLTVSKKNSTVDITFPSDIIFVGEDSTIEIKIPEDATGNATLNVDGKVMDNATVTNGTAKLTLSSLTAGNHTVEVIYSGDGNYNPSNKTENITVFKNNATTDINIPKEVNYGDSVACEVKLPSDANGNVTFKIDGNLMETVDVINGTATLKLSELSVANHTIEAIYSGDDKYNPHAENASFEVNKATTTLTATKVTATYNVNKDLIVTLTDGNGNSISGVKVSVKLSSSKSYTTDKNGQVKVSTKALVPNEYTAKITFAGNENYTQSSTTAKVTVKKAKPKITAKAKTFKNTQKTKKYTIKLKNNKGKAIKNAKVTLKVNGKTYKAKTNSKGKATFKIKKLNKKGTYKAKIAYKGNKYYKKVTKKVKLIVKTVWKTVSKGSKDHNTVKKIQRALKKNGYYITYKGRYLMVDGIFESCTKRSVKEFQGDKNLKSTGKVDYVTAKKLKIVK